jgi:signal recognition particle receptor subunit beta
MAEYNEQQRKLTIKLVYYGPALSGKTTNLMRLHDLLSPELKGEMMTLETKNDRTLFFDLLPLGFRAPSGLLVKFKLFTVPGQVAHDGTRKAVLSRADGVAFIADSQKDQGTNNAESFQNLVDNASRIGLDFESLPLVVQYNKRDLPNIIGEDEIIQRWGKAKWPVFFSSALSGQGVQETFSELLKHVYPKMEHSFKLKTEHHVTEKAFVNSVTGTE